MKTSKEINYFDTPEDRRKGRHGMANLMAAVLEDRAKRREALKNLIPNKNYEKGNTDGTTGAGQLG